MFNGFDWFGNILEVREVSDPVAFRGSFLTRRTASPTLLEECEVVVLSVPHSEAASPL